MAPLQSPHDASINPQNGFCQGTKIFHSICPAFRLPPPNHPFSVASYAVSLLRSPTTPASFALHSTTYLIDASSGRRLSFASFLSQVNSLTYSLKSHPRHPLLRHDVAFIVAPSSLHIPVLYFSLLSLGVAISPSNPLSTPSELAHQISLCKPAIAFAISSVAHKLPPNLPVILLDSPEFLSMLEARVSASGGANDDAVNQSDPAAILYSSGTTGKVKGVVITHRNMMAAIGGSYSSQLLDALPKGGENGVFVAPVSLLPLPLFHVFGLIVLIRLAAVGETLVLMEKYDFVKMLEAVEKYKVMFMPVAPPLLVAMTKSDLVNKYDLSSLQRVLSGGAPLRKEVADCFRAKFPHVEIFQGYGLTESTSGAIRMVGTDATKVETVGRLVPYVEAKIVDPESGESLIPGNCGELWLRGPTVMKGYAGDDAATAATLDTEGWLKTGDLCYFDSDGYLFIVDRLKELIKYKGYQVPPSELEQILQSMPDIADAAVVPYPDEVAGEIPMAYVVRKAGGMVSATQIMNFVAKQVAPYKKIRRVAFVDSIPKSPSGKILRRELIKHALSKPSSKL